MDISDWREHIDRVDRIILALLNERTEFVLRLAELKRAQDIPVEEPDRENAVRKNLTRFNEGPLSDEAVCRVYEAILAEMKAVQREQVTK